MRWPWQRAARTVRCAEPRLLPCATPGIHFEATFTVAWRPALRIRPGLEELVVSHTVARAREIARQFPAVEVRSAQDAVNAELGAVQHTRGTPYRCLTAHTELALSAAARATVAQRRTDEERVQRLRFLRTHLYDHPDLFVLDRIEQLGGCPGSEEVADWHRLARSIAASGQWWEPVLAQWESVGRGFTDVELQNRAMLALHDALEALSGKDRPVPRPPDPLTPARAGRPRA
ncbi:hypothetical protein ACIQNV_38885 [Streptomyces hydrogenans]|uniref:hypothetical protein n=1 Tax=Streptomyces hydrogenans TaxID=1873719 RepID=UPI0034204FEA